MIKKFLIAMMSIVALIAWSSCKENLEDSKDSLEVSPSYDLSFEASGNEDVVLAISTSASSYEVATESWVVCTKSSNSLTINVEDNEIATAREGQLTITAGTADPVVINIYQEAGEEDYISSDPAELLFEAQDEPKELSISTNVENWSYSPDFGNESEEWFSIEQTENILTVSVSDYENMESQRVGSIELSAGDATFSVSITQAAKVLEKNKKNLLVLECNDTNPLNALELKYVDNTPFFQGVVLFSSNIDADESTHQVVFSYNNNVQALLNEREKYVVPLQDAGIKVYLSLLPNHTPAGLGNLRETTAQNLAAEVADVVKEHQLDGVFLDNEYTGTYDESWSDLLYSSSSEAHYARFAYELKQALTSACDWDTEVILYQYNDVSFSTITGLSENISAGTYLDLVMPDYGYATQYADRMGLSASQQFCISQSVRSYNSTSVALRLNTAETWKNRVGEWFGFYNLVLDPDAGTFNWQYKVPIFFAGVANLVHGCDIQAPTGYYKKLGEGSYSDTRYEYEFTMLYNGNTWDNVWY